MNTLKSEFEESGKAVARTVYDERDRMLRAYRYWRILGHKAVESIVVARANAAAGQVMFPSSAKCWGYGPEFEACGQKRMRWIENPADCGLRFVGYADECSGAVTHTGWYLDHDGHTGESVRGVVYQLPAKNGRPRFVAGYADPFNDGPVCLSFDDVVEGERDSYSNYAKDNPEAMTAASWADSIAESYADNEKDYREAFDKAQICEDCDSRLSVIRAQVLEIIRELKKFRSPSACALTRDELSACMNAIEERLQELLSERSELQRKRQTIIDDYRDQPGFDYA